MKTAAFALLFVSCVSVSAFGQTYRVNSTRDALDNNPGDRICWTGLMVDGVRECTLRGAVIEANAPGWRRGGLIILPAGTFVLTRGTEPGDMSGQTEDLLQAVGVPTTIASRTRDLDIDTTLFIEGAGPGLTIIDGNDSDRLFHIMGLEPGSNQGFTNLTIRNGLTRERRGGCVLREGTQGLLSFMNVVLEQCIVVDQLGGAVFNAGAVIFERTTVRSSGASHGGGLYNIGIAQIFSSTFQHNGGQTSFTMQGRGGAIYNGVGVTPGDLWIRNSSVVENAAAVGGGIYNEGTASIQTSTISGNNAGTGAGILNANRPSARVGVASSTIANNNGEGIRRGPLSTAGVAQTIIAGNVSNPYGLVANCDGGLTSSRESMEDANTCGLAGPGDLPNTDPELAPLANYGGYTVTHALQPTSPAIDATTRTDNTFDQRGLPRPWGPRHDIGAYEVGFDPAFTIIDVPIRWEDLFGRSLPRAGVGFSAMLSLSGPERRNYYNEAHFTGVKSAEGQSQLKVELDPSGQKLQVSGVTAQAKADFNLKGKKAPAEGAVLFYVSVQRPLRGVATLRIRDAACACDAKPVKRAKIVLPPFKMKDVQ